MWMELYFLNSRDYYPESLSFLVEGLKEKKKKEFKKVRKLKKLKRLSILKMFNRTNLKLNPSEV